MSNQPLVSIIVPVYNAQEYLSKCMDSLLAQTYKNLELIFVNDGSKDDSLKILHKYNDSRIRIINKKNVGVSAARNDGLKAANGQFIMFVDADDWIENNTCEKAVKEILEENADIVMWSYYSEGEKRSVPKKVYNGRQVFVGNDVKQRLHRRFIGVVGEELSHPELADSLCPVWGKLYKESLVSGLSFIDLEEIGTYEDGLFNLYAFENAQKVVYLPEYFYHYRRSTTESITSGYRNRLFEQWQNLFSIMKKYIQANKLESMYSEALENRIALSILGLGLNEMSSNKSFVKKYKDIKKIISLPEYKEAYQNLDYTYFPIHWKVFYGFAKFRAIVFLNFMLICIKYIVK